jgi:hypothetical protein
MPCVWGGGWMQAAAEADDNCRHLDGGGGTDMWWLVYATQAKGGGDVKQASPSPGGWGDEVDASSCRSRWKWLQRSDRWTVQ